MKKGFILGLATGIMLTGASLVFANSQIQAILNNQIKVTLNGQVQEFRDETTNELQYPITYKDRTYLPLRTVANLVGVDVDYDSNTNTALLKNDENKYAKIEQLAKKELMKIEGVKEVIINEISIFSKESTEIKNNGEKKYDIVGEDTTLLNVVKDSPSLFNVSTFGNIEYTLIFENEEGQTLATIRMYGNDIQY